MKRKDNNVSQNSPKKKLPWHGMKLSFLGKATDLIQQGGGKLSIVGGDPGEGKKQNS